MQIIDIVLIRVIICMSNQQIDFYKSAFKPYPPHRHTNQMNPLYQQSDSLFRSQQQFLQQQKTLHLSNLIQTFSDPSIKNLQSHNKNKVQRELLDIATNFYSMIDKLQMIKWFCIDYKTTLESYRREEVELQRKKVKQQEIQVQNDLLSQFRKAQRMIDESLENSMPLFFQQQLSIHSNGKSTSNIMGFPHQLQGQPQPQPNPKPLIVLPARRLQTNKQQIQSTINKMKVMVVKVNTTESTSYQHVYSTYISRLKYTLQNSNLDQKRFKMHKIKSILNYLPKKYILLKLQSRNIYPYHPTRYPNPELIGYQYMESPMFFINFYCQQLLFFNGQPIVMKPYFAELLYCPVIFVKGKADESMRISGWYYEQLAYLEPMWRSTVLVIKVFNTQTSLKHPIYYSHMSLKKFQLPNQLKNSFDQVNKGFHFMQHKYSNEQQLLGDLQSIKSYLYQMLMFNHLKKIISRNPHTDKDSNKVHIMINDCFKVEFQLINDIEVKETLKNVLYPKKNLINKKNVINVNAVFELPEKASQSLPEPLYKPELITDLLLFYKRKNLFTLKRATLSQDLEILFKTTLFKILTEDMEYRTVSPNYSGSLGLYYYEKRTIRKSTVDDFFAKFA